MSRTMMAKKKIWIGARSSPSLSHKASKTYFEYRTQEKAGDPSAAGVHNVPRAYTKIQLVARYLRAAATRPSQTSRKGRTEDRRCLHPRLLCSASATDSKEMPDWWEEVVEKTRGHEGLPKDWFDSTLALFVLYAMTFSDWVDEFALYNYRMLLASVRCFDECRGLPYNFVQSTATEGRCDDRGSIGYYRMIRGAILYRVFNCLSTFSRWGAVKALAAKMNKTIFTTGHWIQLPTSLLGRSSPIWSIFNIIVN